MTAEKQSPFLSGGPTRRDRLPVLVGPLVGVLAALVCGISVLTGVVVVHNMQQELTGVRQENTGLRERLVAVENLLDGAFAGHDRQAVGSSKVCLNICAFLVSGVAGGTHFHETGGGTNYQCLPTDPQWGTYLDGVQQNQGRAFMYGGEYQIHTNAPFGSTSLLDHDVPCAVGYVPTRGSKLMIPARNTCYSGWTREYQGYLMASHYSHAGSKEFVCVDEQPETVSGGHEDKQGALFYPVEARCGSLPCPRYKEGRELTCVVCTK
ncbi:PREDICTED: uncharacterized protein LOC109472786 [Branchiostoma belcheri]|uniref:Uncharacterized protein LOC109472786 n=1 Tax=Branchiostoma belcheri TaxID=7741 RepID=A0A6P4YG37_BRABE|nr:PREDICTED: uncharacterized protein LOC109472786 [Branchiostoma belcheri]